MNIRELRDALREALPDADVPQELPADDMYPFTFVSKAFIAPFMEALVRVELSQTDTGADADGSARARLETLAGLAERVFADGDDETVDPLAVRLVFNRLVRRPGLLEAAWPSFGPHTRAIADKFRALDEQCRLREEAARGTAVSAGLASAGRASGDPVSGDSLSGDSASNGLVHSDSGVRGAPCP